MMNTVKLFISHSSHDRDLALRFWHDLRDQSIEVWQYDESALPGMDAWEPILEQIEGSDFFVVLISASSLSSNAVREEINHAHYCRINSRSRKPTIIPVILEPDVESPRKIRRFGRIDMSGGSYEEKLALLLRTIGIARNDQPPQQEEPRHIIQLGVGLQTVRIGDSKEAMLHEFGFPSKDDGKYLCFYDLGMDALLENGCIKTLFFYFRTPGHNTFDGRTAEGIRYTSGVSDVLKAYGEPDKFSHSIISDFGVQPGALDFYLPYSTKGVSFSFYDDDLADVRIWKASPQKEDER